MKFPVHFFIPKEEGRRAKSLHPVSFLLTSVILLIFAFLIRDISHSYPHVLGAEADIEVEKLLLFTNKERQKAGLSPLRLDEKLVVVANEKSKDLITKNYWAHNAPDGTAPWELFTRQGYRYSFAGENLARGFDSAEEAVAAWMASDKHRENILSPNFRDVGFSVRRGQLKGEDTILIVQEFGSRDTYALSDSYLPEVRGGATSKSILLLSGEKTEALLNKLFVSQGLFSLVILFFVSIFAIDMYLLNKKGLRRVLTHNADHIMFLLTLFAIGIFMLRGVVL